MCIETKPNFYDRSSERLINFRSSRAAPASVHTLTIFKFQYRKYSKYSLLVNRLTYFIKSVNSVKTLRSIPFLIHSTTILLKV